MAGSLISSPGGFASVLPYHRLMMLVLIASLILWSLVLAGCSSSSNYMPSIYLISAAYKPSSQAPAVSNSSSLAGFLMGNATRNANIHVRTGFFATCVHASSTLPDEQYWGCGHGHGFVSGFDSSVDPLGLVDYNARFSLEIVFYGLIIGSMVLSAFAVVLFGFYPQWYLDSPDGTVHQVKSFPSKHLISMILGALCGSVLFGFVSIMWLHVGAVAATGTLDILYGVYVQTRVGAVALALGWLGFALQGLALIMVVVLILSMRLLGLLTDDD